MRLKRLELFGFKSFADRTHLDFEGSLTGIVGPNGCGKSNVVDAMRWVLGETRPTSMRGGEMADVVFKGSVSRPAMGVAEVGMVLDNASGVFAGRGAEVAITRRVFTSGEGEYQIDGERCRLKDIKNLLFDTGLGSRGYSVLEQGRIDAVLSANPLDRRAVFEEAAGISRYRQRRREAESKLLRVSGDLERLDDVLRELGTRVRSLKIQAGKAERFVAARDAWRAERGRFLRHRLFALREELGVLERALVELERQSAELRQARAAKENDVAERARQQQSLAAEVDRLADEVARLSGESRAADERHAQLSLRIAAWRTGAVEEGDRALALASQLETREAELEGLERRAASSEALAGEARAAHAAVDERLRGARTALREARAASEAQNAAVLGALHDKTAARNRQHHLSELLPTLGERGSRSAARLGAAQGAAGALAREVGRAREALGASEAELGQAEGQAARLTAACAGLEGEVEALRAARGQRELERERLRATLAVLRDREREREALEAGARALLESVGRGAGPCAPEDLAGIVADHLRIPSDLARALDAALGTLAQALVARERELLAPLVAWLDAERAGQAHLVVPGGLAGGNGPARGAQLSDELAGRTRGRLIDRVTCAEGFRSLAELLIGDVLLVEGREQALLLARDFPGWRFATPSGDCVDEAGLWGGHREITHGPVGRRVYAEELEIELAAAAAALEDTAAELTGVEAERERRAAELVLARDALERTRGERATASAELRAGEARLLELESHVAVVAGEGEALAAELAQLTADVAASEAALATSQAAFEALNASLAAAEAERRELEAALDALQREAASSEVALTRAEAEHEGLAQRIRDLAAVVREARTELERARRLAGEQTALAERGEQEVAALREELARVKTERARTEGELDTLRTTERAGREAIEAYRRRVDAATRELEELGARLAEARLDEQRVRLSREELSVRVQEDLGVGAGELLDGFTPEAELAEPAALEALDRRVAELKAELDRLGPVNTEAVHELEEAASRSEFLGGQRGDLAHSQKSLAEAIRRMDEESERLFLETFHEVRGHFQALFRQLFGGGKADLALAEGLSPLEAGIEISARPPGREMLPIGLLSGGQRTMTALALLFAVFRARPSPFCVLDEVDAALDDANIGRFLAMLDSFRAGTQFIVVTHNKGTMAACERLYGITMQTKGVSTHVSVEFEKIDGFVPEARGNASEAERSREEVTSAQVALDEEYEIPPPAHRPARDPGLERGGNGEAGVPIDLAPEPAEA